MKNVNDRVERNDEFVETSGEEIQGQPLDEAVILNQMLGAAEEIRNAPKVRILMHNQEGALGNQPVFVAANGMGYSIPRDVPCVVPVPILKALEDAVETKYYREEKDGQLFGPILERQVRRYAFSILS